MELFNFNIIDWNMVGYLLMLSFKEGLPMLHITDKNV